MFGRIGPWEILLIFLVLVLLFGGRKIPEIAKGLGKGIKDFKASLSGAAETDEDGKPLAKPDQKSAEPPKS